MSSSAAGYVDLIAEMKRIELDAARAARERTVGGGLGSRAVAPAHHHLSAVRKLYSERPASPHRRHPADAGVPGSQVRIDRTEQPCNRPVVAHYIGFAERLEVRDAVSQVVQSVDPVLDHERIRVTGKCVLKGVVPQRTLGTGSNT